VSSRDFAAVDDSVSSRDFAAVDDSVTVRFWWVCTSLKDMKKQGCGCSRCVCE
jgi:hypothetical protein